MHANQTMLGVLALLGRLRGRKEHYHKFEPRRGCMVNARPAWTTG